MKLFIASDIHGSAYYTRIMLRRYDESGADKLILLGDILYHGPRNDLPREYAPKEVAAMLNKYASDIIAVRGNCEAEVDSLMLDFNVTSDYGVVFIDNKTIYLSHGHRSEPKFHEGNVYITGHTHIPHDFTDKGVRYLNPGSISIPKNFTKHSAIIYENGEFKWIDIESSETYLL